MAAPRYSCVIGSEQRTVRLARLEVHGAVLDLDNHVVGKLSVERHELLVGLIGTVAALRIIHEGTPHHHAIVRLQHPSQHIGSVGMRASEVLRSRFSLRIGLYQEAAEVGNHPVDVVHLLFPPVHHVGIQRVGCGQSTQFDGRGEVDGEIHPDAVWAQLVGNAFRLLQTLVRECLRLRVHIVQHRTVDAYRGIGAGIHLHALGVGIQEDTLTRKTTLAGAVGVVPVVQNAQVEERPFADVEPRGRLSRLLQSEQVVGTVEQSCIGGSGNHRLLALALDGIAVVGNSLLPFQRHGPGGAPSR